MTQITGGTVKYGRLVRPADFENKSAEVILSFDGGEGYEAELDKAAAIAVAKVHTMLSLSPPIDPPEKPKQVRRTAPKPVTEIPPTKTEPDEDFLGLGGVETQAAPEQPEIPDRELLSEITQHLGKMQKKKADPANPGKIRALLIEFLPIEKAAVPKAAELPQEKRAAFIAKLRELA